MSIWGKILGGAAGFAVGGPIGALLGAVAGHAVDRIHRDETGEADATQSVAFTIGVIVLSAKMARVDGVVKQVEVDTFKRIFRVPPEELRNVGRIFDLARRDAQGFEGYARQLARLFESRPAVLEELLEGLLRIAEADGTLHDAEYRYLADVARIFGFSDSEFARIMATHRQTGTAPAGDSDPFAVLGLAPDAALDDIKATYRRLMREYHPDRLIAEGMPQEFIDLATGKTATINTAYERIMKARQPG
jgi:DnaJ like chaperone protein